MYRQYVTFCTFLCAIMVSEDSRAPYSTFEKGQKKNPEAFKQREEEIQVAVGLKYMSGDTIVPLSEIYSLADIVPSDKEITEFSLQLSKQLGATFKSPVKFVSELETLVFDHYSLFVEEFKSWTPPAPRMKEE